MDPGLVQLVSSVGFPIAVALWLLLELPKLRKAIEDNTVETRKIVTLLEYQAGLRRRDEVSRSEP